MFMLLRAEERRILSDDMDSLSLDRKRKKDAQAGMHATMIAALSSTRLSRC